MSRLLGGEGEHTLVLWLTCLLLGRGVTVREIGNKVVLQQLLGAEDSLALLGEWTKASSNTDPLVSKVASNIGQPIEDKMQVNAKWQACHNYIILPSGVARTLGIVGPQSCQVTI